MPMNTKQLVVLVTAVGAIAFGGYLVSRNIGNSGPSRSDLESVMHNLPTEELILRRRFMHAQIEDAKSKGVGPRPDMLASAEAGLIELDGLLRSRGIDPETITSADAGAPAEWRDERP
jgi:hypothetical protein